MGANAELDVFLKKEDFSLQHVFSLLEMEGLSISIQEIRSFDDWEYVNNIQAERNSIDFTMNSDLFLKKFTLINFVVNNKWRCILIISLLKDRYIDFSFALDTDDLLKHEENDIDNCIALLYDEVTNAINSNINKEPFKECFVAASMGLEYSVHFDSNLVGMLNDDNGVRRWVLPKDTGKGIQIKKFLKEERSDTIIFDYFY